MYIASKLSQYIKVVATNPNNLTLNPSIHMMDGEKRLLKVVLWLKHACCDMCTATVNCICATTHVHTNKSNKFGLKWELARISSCRNYFLCFSTNLVVLVFWHFCKSDFTGMALNQGNFAFITPIDWESALIFKSLRKRNACCYYCLMPLN